MRRCVPTQCNTGEDKAEEFVLALDGVIKDSEHVTLKTICIAFAKKIASAWKMRMIHIHLENIRLEDPHMRQIKKITTPLFSVLGDKALILECAWLQAEKVSLNNKLIEHMVHTGNLNIGKLAKQASPSCQISDLKEQNTKSQISLTENGDTVCKLTPDQKDIYRLGSVKETAKNTIYVMMVKMCI